MLKGSMVESTEPMRLDECPRERDRSVSRCGTKQWWICGSFSVLFPRKNSGMTIAFQKNPPFSWVDVFPIENEWMFQCHVTCTLVFRGCFCLVERYIHEVMLKRAVDVRANLCQLSTAWPRGALGGLCWWRHARGFDPWLGVLNTTGWKYPVQWPWMTMTLTEFAKMNVKPTPCPSIDALIKVSNAEIRDAWRSSEGIIPESVVVPQLASRGVENACLPREAGPRGKKKLPCGTCMVNCFLWEKYPP